MKATVDGLRQLRRAARRRRRRAACTVAELFGTREATRWRVSSGSRQVRSVARSARPTVRGRSRALGIRKLQQTVEHRRHAADPRHDLQDPSTSLEGGRGQGRAMRSEDDTMKLGRSAPRRGRRPEEQAPRQGRRRPASAAPPASGHKGQKARSGGRIHRWFEGGQMPLQRRAAQARLHATTAASSTRWSRSSGSPDSPAGTVVTNELLAREEPDQSAKRPDQAARRRRRSRSPSRSAWTRRARRRRRRSKQAGGTVELPASRRLASSGGAERSDGTRRFDPEHLPDPGAEAAAPVHARAVRGLPARASTSRRRG